MSKKKADLSQFEQTLSELEQIVQQLEQGELSLDQSLQQFERGITLARHSQQLLQSAEQYGLTPSFGCRMGVCFQCVCEKVSGQVRDMRSGTLSGHGREQIQLCISQPVSELVIKL